MSYAHGFISIRPGRLQVCYFLNYFILAQVWLKRHMHTLFEFCCVLITRPGQIMPISLEHVVARTIAVRETERIFLGWRAFTKGQRGFH